MSNNAVLDNILTKKKLPGIYRQTGQQRRLRYIILKAAIYAPSGMSRQSWQFTVIRKKKTYRNWQRW